LPQGRTEVRAAVSETLEELSTASSGADVVLQLQEATVACAPEVLGQILRNVIGNALKYRASERACRLEISSRVETSWVSLGGRATGRGREAPAARGGFEPFFRGTSDGSGHGLGLAIVDSYVRALGGSVQMRSEPGVGTRVSVRLPRTAGSAEGILDPPGPPVRAHRTLETGT